MNTNSERRRRTISLLLFAGVAIVLLALTWDLRPYPLSARVDDSRYVLSAHYIKLLPTKLIHHTVPLDWLGPYDQTTLIKRPGFSVVLAVLSALHLPYLQTVLLLHLIGVSIFANALLRLKYPSAVVAFTFVLCGLFPTLYDANAVRVIREVSTGALEIAILGLCVSLFTVNKNRAVEIFWSPAFLGMLVLLGLHWSMREEAVLLLPAVWLLTCGALWVRSKDNLRYKAALVAAATLAIVLPSGVAYFTVARLNHASYGISVANEISEGSFPRAVGALKSVQEGPCDHTLLTAVEAQKILAVSPSFADVGNVLKAVVSQKPDITYTDAFAIMRVSALQDDTIRTNPLLTQDLYARIANEVEAACRSGALKCAKPALRGIIPLLCRSQWPLVSSMFVEYVTEHIAALKDSGLSPLSSRLAGIERLSPPMLAMFEEIAVQKMAGRHDDLLEYSQPASLKVLQAQDYRRRYVANLYESFVPWLMAVGAGIFSLRLLFWSDRGRPWTVIILVALAGHVLCRAAVFSYLSAVDGYLNNRYISVCYPVAAAFAALASTELIRLFLARRTDSKAKKLGVSETVTRGVPWPATIVVALVGASFLYAGGRSGIPLPEPEAVLLDGKLGFESGREFLSLHGQQIQLLDELQGWLTQDAGGLLGDSAIFDGWCKDVANGQPAKALLIVVNGQLINESTLSIPWPEVEAHFPEGIHAGFNVSVPRAFLKRGKVRVFALLPNNRAGELVYPPLFPYPH